MKAFARLARRFQHDQAGAAATEYAVMLSLVLVTAIGAISVFGNGLTNECIMIINELFG